MVAKVSAYDSTNTMSASTAHAQANHEARRAARAGVTASKSRDDGSSAAAASSRPMVATAARSAAVRAMGSAHWTARDASGMPSDTACGTSPPTTTATTRPTRPLTANPTGSSAPIRRDAVELSTGAVSSNGHACPARRPRSTQPPAQGRWRRAPSTHTTAPVLSSEFDSLVSGDVEGVERDAELSDRRTRWP